MNMKETYLKEYCKEILKIPYSKLTKKHKEAIEKTVEYLYFCTTRRFREVIDTQLIKVFCNILGIKKLDKKKKKKNYKSL